MPGLGHTVFCKTCREEISCGCKNESDWNPNYWAPCPPTLCAVCKEIDVQQTMSFEEPVPWSDGLMSYKVMYTSGLFIPVALPVLQKEPEIKWEYNTGPPINILSKTLEKEIQKPEKIDPTPVYVPGTQNLKPEGGNPYHLRRRLKVNMHSKLGKALLRRPK